MAEIITEIIAMATRRGVVGAMLVGVLLLELLVAGAASVQDDPRDSARGGGTVVRQEAPGFGILATTATTVYATIAPTLTTNERERRDQQQAKQLHLISTSLEILLQEMSAGGGEHLAALADLLGCPWSYRPDLFRLAQNRFAVIVPNHDPTPSALLANLRSEIDGDGVLAEVCRWV